EAASGAWSRNPNSDAWIDQFATSSRSVVAKGGKPPCDASNPWVASASCFRWLAQRSRRAASRADWTAGSNSAASSAITPSVTRSSTSVNPPRRPPRSDGLMASPRLHQDGDGQHDARVISTAQAQLVSPVDLEPTG